MEYQELLAAMTDLEKPVVEFRTAYDVWLLGWSSTGHAPPRQILYRIEY
jgi:hypothetical protein